MQHGPLTAFGPTLPICDQVHAEKYRMRGEDFRSAMTRVASTLADNEDHFNAFREILLTQRFMPAGRIQAAVGSTKAITPYNCFVSGTIEDSYVDGTGSIMERAKQAALTMRLGGGIGYDFSTLRPRGELIKKLQSQSSGAVSFIKIFDAVGCATSSSGHRRGAQMGVLRVDHPDIEEFIRAKQGQHALTGFNLSVGITNEFMRLVKGNGELHLRHNGKTYHSVQARTLWYSIMRSTYDWADPGVLFIDQINEMNNLFYCEHISATNPCGEQPLPPYGACLLGSFNLVKYLQQPTKSSKKMWLDLYQLLSDIPHVVRAMDNVIDEARYPLYEQEQEAKSKRRMGLGLTGVANAIEATGCSYGDVQFLNILEHVLARLRDGAYEASIELAKEKGPFQLFRPDYLSSRFIRTLPDHIQSLAGTHGIRNSHLLSIAPTGTISFAADNISSGIEPVFAHSVRRSINAASGPRLVDIDDYGVRQHKVYGRTVEDTPLQAHLDVLALATRYVDSAVSKTINVPADIGWEAFQDIYMKAWELGAKGCTTYRKGGRKEGIMTSTEEAPHLFSEPINTCELRGGTCE